MKAMILAAGFGTRLLPLTRVLPKPMFPVVNRPLLAHTIDRLVDAGIRDIAINLHHLPDKVTHHFGDGSQWNVRLHFSLEREILGTAGGIKAVQGFLEDGPFVVINSDVVADIDLNTVLEFHREKGSCLTLVVREDASPEKYDPIEIDDNGRIVHFIGAPSSTLPENTSRVMFTGIQIMEPEIFARIPEGRFCGTTEDIFPEMIREGFPVYGYFHEGYWIDMGNRESYLQLHEDVFAGKLKLEKPPSFEPENPYGNWSINPPVHMGEHCVIAENAQVGPHVILGDGCRVEAGAVVEHSVCWEGAVIGSEAKIRRSVLAQNVVVRAGEEVVGQSLIGTK